MRTRPTHPTDRDEGSPAPVREVERRAGAGRATALALSIPLAILLATACSPPPPPEWHDADGHRWRDLRTGGGWLSGLTADAGFTVMESSRTGVEFSNTVSVERALDNEHLLVGSGVALGDVDGDGRTDIYLARLEGPNVLYRNLGEWRFEDVTAAAGVAAEGRFSTGTAMADLDGDGDLDLVVTSLGGPDVVYLNDGAGRFAELADAGLEDGLGSTTVTLADVDGDADLDLYVTAYKSESASDVFGMLERSPREVFVGGGDSLAVPPELGDHYRIEERDGRRVAVEQAEADRLYLNDGSGRFEPVSWTGGAFVDGEGRPLTREIDDFGLSARFYDVDADGDADLYVCNDFHDPDQLWLGRGDGTFRAAPPHALRSTSHASMSVDFADVDRDGRVDFFVAEMRTRDPRRRLREVPFQKRITKPVGVIDDRPQVQRNTLFLNRGDGSFTEIAQLAGVDASEWSWTSMFLDVDLDGFEDLLVANGYSRDTQHGDIADRLTELQGQADTRELKRLYPELENRNAAFRNRGDLTFEDVGPEWGVGTEEDISHGMAAGDLDGDGDLDVVVNRLDAPARLLRNDGREGRVAVRLRGAGGNSRGVGARVRLRGGAVPLQEREMTAGGLYLSGSEPLLVFAAGEGDSLSLEVAWLGGARSVVDDVRPDRLYEIREEGARPPAGVAAAPSGEAAAPTAGTQQSEPLFVDRTELLGHRHPENAFDDFRRQPLLPFGLSRLGPGVSWIDVDRDGDPDLVVPPGKGGTLGYLRNDGGRFTRVPLADSAAPFDLTAAVPLPGPAGGTRLVVGQSDYEDPRLPTEGDVAPVLGVVAGTGEVPTVRPLGGSGGASPSRGAPGSTGPLAVADVDGDGDLDLFLGGRVVRAIYPVPAASRLLLSEGSRLRPDASSREVLAEVGMVSGATFSDVDGDGDPDLLLATEWGPVRLLLNDGGRLTDATEAWGLAGLRGRWNGIAAGDLDGDGRMDAVVTGWGRNMRDRPRPGRPLVVFHDDLDGNGAWDVLLTRPPEEGEDPVPLVDYHWLRLALPSLVSRVPTFDAYAEASLEEILGRPPEDVYRRPATGYDHQLLLNRGDRFEARPLPLEAQFAPSMGVVIGDLDGDGREDVFLAQNFFHTHPRKSRHDAGRGLLLRGDGAGGLEPVPSNRSGIRVWGDQRGAALADYDGDGRVDLAVAQNGAATRLFRNVGARPGLRVRLMGPPGNPDGIGAVIRVEYAEGTGPAREIHGGSGYWSVDDPVQVLGLEGEPVAVRVRWPGGRESRVPVPPGATTVTAEMP